MSQFKGLVEEAPALSASETTRSIVRPPLPPAVNFTLSETPATMLSAAFLLADSEATRLGFRLLLRIVITEVLQAALREIQANPAQFKEVTGERNQTERLLLQIGYQRFTIRPRDGIPLPPVGAAYHGFMPQPGDEDHERIFDDIGSARSWLKVAATSQDIADRADRVHFPQASLLIVGPERETPQAQVATEELIERNHKDDITRVVRRPLPAEQAALR
jgi:hypothetical protein